jgi:hypothetical protein
MGMNPYFKQDIRSEQLLYNDIVVEALEIYGQSVYYLPRTIVNEDTIFGDDVPSRFGSGHKISMYIENIDGFDGEGDLFTRFGVEIRDEATFIVSRKKFEKLVSRIELNNNERLIRPLEGDLIFLPMSNKLFQIMHVEHEQPFYQLQNLPVYKMRCQLFEYSGEDMDTGIEDVDVLEEKYAYTYQLTLSSTSSTIQVGDTASQLLDSATNLTISGEVTDWSDSDKILELAHVGSTDGMLHTFVTNRPLTISHVFGGDSDGYIITAVNEDNRLSANEQNDDFSTESTDFLDFSENNPFGDPENS